MADQAGTGSSKFKNGTFASILWVTYLVTSGDG